MGESSVKGKLADFLINLIIFIALVFSYKMTLDMLVGDHKEFEFVKGCFIFLVPCAGEGLTALGLARTKRILVDKIEVVITLVSIGAVVSALAIIFMDIQNNTAISILKILLTIYPIKIGVNIIDCLYDLTKKRWEAA